ncbi:TetR/AcrR family transcriptional regulator [Streptomyces violaceorubidus]
MLRAQLMGAVFAALVPGVPMPVPVLRAELFERYRLDWKLGVPPDAEASGGTTCDPDLSRFFATGVLDRPDRVERDGTDPAAQSK